MKKPRPKRYCPECGEETGGRAFCPNCVGVCEHDTDRLWNGQRMLNFRTAADPRVRVFGGDE